MRKTSNLGMGEAMRRAEEANKKMIANRIANQSDVSPSSNMEEYITELDTLNSELRSLSEFIERAKRYKSDYNQQIESARRTGDKAKADYYQQKRDEIQKQINAREARTQEVQEAILHIKQRQKKKKA